MTRITTHVLDTSRGRPAAGIEVRLEDAAGRELARAATDADGRIGRFPLAAGEEIQAGTYLLRFATGAYLADDAGGSRTAFYPEVAITFSVAAGEEHYHVPLLLSPYGYSTYRGS